MQIPYSEMHVGLHNGPVRIQTRLPQATSGVVYVDEAIRCLASEFKHDGDFQVKLKPALDALVSAQREGKTEIVVDVVEEFAMRVGPKKMFKVAWVPDCTGEVKVFFVRDDAMKFSALHETKRQPVDGVADDEIAGAVIA